MHVVTRALRLVVLYPSPARGRPPLLKAFYVTVILSGKKTESSHALHSSNREAKHHDLCSLFIPSCSENPMSLLAVLFRRESKHQDQNCLVMSLYMVGAELCRGLDSKSC